MKVTIASLPRRRVVETGRPFSSLRWSGGAGRAPLGQVPSGAFDAGACEALDRPRTSAAPAAAATATTSGSRNARLLTG
jgi:hypothetical protein